MSESLIALVPDRLLPLSEAEKRMLEFATKGEPAICGQNDLDDDPENAPGNSENWLPSRIIRADILEWLCTTDIASKVSRQGIHIYAAKISGILKFAYTSISFPLRFQRCVFTHDISFTNARIPSLILDGSWTRTILADGVDVANSVLLIAGFHSFGQVLFRDAKIGGNFRTDGASFEYASGTTFDLQSENSLGCHSNCGSWASSKEILPPYPPASLFAHYLIHLLVRRPLLFDRLRQRSSLGGAGSLGFRASWCPGRFLAPNARVEGRQISFCAF